MTTTPLHQPILRKFALWMLGLVVLFGGMVYFTLLNRENVDPMAGELIVQFLALLPICWFIWQVMNQNLGFSYFFNLRIKPFDWKEYLLLIVLIIVVSIGLEALFTFLLSWVVPDYVTHALAEPILVTGAPFSVHFLTLILAIVIGPLMEEIVFRGLIFQRLSIKYGMKVGVLGSSLIFGLLHAEAWLGAAVFGAMMCLLFYHTKNLLVPLVVHMLNNTVAVLLDGTLREGDVISLEQYQSTGLYFLMGLLALPAIVIVFRRYWKTHIEDLPYLYNAQDAARITR